MSALHHCTRALLAKHSARPSPRRISIATHCALILAFALSSPGKDVHAQQTRTINSQINGDVDGTASDDAFTFEDAGEIDGTLDGGMGTDTLIGNNNGNSFTLTGSNSGQLADSAGMPLIGGGFTGIENLTGGSGADTFTFEDSGEISGSISGGTGADHLNYSAKADRIIVELTGSDTSGFSSGAVAGFRFVIMPPALPAVVGTTLTGGFSGIDQLTASANSLNELRGDDAAAIWTLGANTTYALMRAGQADTLTFSGFAKLEGGSGADTFTINAAHKIDLDGGAGNDRFNINAEISSTFGRTGDDTFTFAAAGRVNPLSAAPFALLQGDAGTDTLIAADTGGQFTLSGGGSGQLADGAGNTLIGGTGFDGIENLIGGTGADTFTFEDGGTLTGNLEGGMGTDTLTGDNNGNTFTLTGNGEGTLMDKIGGGFTNIENLTGGSMADTFTFQVGSTLTGNITGGMGSDHLDYSAVTGDISTTLDGSNATGFSSAVVTITNLPQLPPDDVQRLTGGFTGINQLTGGTGTDSLTGDDADATWTLGADAQGNERNSYALMRSVVGGQPATDTLTFSSFENLTGGSLADTFNINAAHSGDLDGRGGTDSFDIRATLTGALTGGAGADRFTLHADGRIAGGSLAGGTGTDTLIGNNNGNAFSLTGNNNGQLADSAGTALIANGFTGIENLTGGTGNDRFAFAAAGSLSGNLVGGAGTDHLDYSARTDSLSATLTASDADGFSGGAVMATVAAGQTPITGGFSGINQLTGGTATDSLTGDDADATWTLGADAQGNERNSYALMRSVVGGQPVTDTLTFSGFDNLTGGSLADTFNIDAAHSGDLDGGAGADTFNIANTLMGNIDGGAGDDTFTFSGAGAITGTLAGGTGDDTLNFMALSDVERLSVMMTDAATGTGVASFINGGGAAGFTGIETLEGFLMRFTGDANRHARWTLASAGNSYQALTAPASDPNAETVGASINLTASVNTLVGGDLSDTFDIATAFDGTLQGGAGDNTFTFADGGSIAGAASGGAGTDHLDYGARTAPITITLTASDAMGFAGGPVVATRTQTRLTGGFTGIDRLTGGTGTDSLTGHNAAATWTLGTAGNSYAVGNQSLVFSNFENLTGGNMADSFTLSIDHTGNLDAGAGDDVFNLADGGEVGEIAGGAGTDHLDYSRRTDAATLNVTLARRDAGGFSGTAPATDGFSGINQLTGRQGDSRLIGMDVSAIWTLDTAGNSYTGTGGQTQDPLRFSGFATLIGRSNADSFTINTNHSGDIIGGDGADAFIFGNDGSLSGNLTGGDGDDRLQGDDDDNRFTLSARNEGTLDDKIGGRFFGIENLTGGSGADTFTFEDSGEISGTLEGGMGTDHLDHSSRTDAIRVTLTASDAMGFDGRATATDGFSGIDRLSGGTGIDRLTGHNAAAAWTLGAAGNSYAVGNQSLVFSNFENLIGGSMADTFTLSADHTGNIDTGAGNDSITLAGSARITGDINLGEGDDSLSFASADVRFMGLADGGAGTDTLNGLDLFTRAMPTTLFRYTNFEIVNGEAELLANLPVIRMQETETTAAMRTLISYVDRPPEGIMPDPDSMGTDTDSTDRMGAGADTDMGMDGDGMDMGGMDGGDMAGMGTDTDSTDRMGAGADTDMGMDGDGMDMGGMDGGDVAGMGTGPDSTDRMGAGIDTDMGGDGMDMGGMDGGDMAGMGTDTDSTDTDMGMDGDGMDMGGMDGGDVAGMGTGPDSTDRMGAGIDTDMGGDGMDMGGMDGGDMAGMGTDTDSTDTDMGMDGDGMDMGGMDGGNMAGMGTDTDTDTPTPPTAPVTPTRETEMAERIAALSRDYGGEVTPLNAAGDGPRDVNAYLFVDPTGPAAQAASVEALSIRINQILNQRLSGGLRGGRHAARPVSSGMNQSMNQSNNQITQRLSGGLAGGRHALRPQPQAAEATGGGDGPLLWGEVFAAERRRGQDGLTLSHVHDYQGLVFGAEQVDPSGQQRLGVLFGYADADIRTDLRSLELDTGSLFGGVYGRFSRQALAINLGLNLGYESHDNRRYIPQLQQVAEADYHSIFVNPWLSLSRAWPLREGLELRPALMLNYSVARYDGYEERGGQGFALAVAGRTAHNLSTRLQLAGVRTEPDTGHELGLRLGVEGRLAGGGHFEGRLGGSSFDYSDAEDRSAQAVFIGLDGRHALSEALTLQLDVEYSHHIGGVSERSLGGFVRLEYAY